MPQYVGHPIQARNVAPSTITWTGLPYEYRWYRTDEQLSFSIGGARPNTVQEYINGQPFGNPYDSGGGVLRLSTYGQGGHVYEIRVQNAGNNGNPASVKWQGGYDTELPGASIQSGPQPGTWIKPGQSVTYFAEDGRSGFKDSHWWFQNATSGDWNQVNPRAVPLPTQDGKWPLRVEVQDRAWTGNDEIGNKATLDFGEYWIDGTSPSISDPTFSIPSPSDAASVTVSATASDALSGIASFRALANGVEFGRTSGGTGAFAWDTGILADGTYTVTLEATDVAGNVTALNRSYVIDRIAPTVTLALGPATPNGLNGWYVVAPTVTLTPGASGGTPSLRYTVNGGAETAYAGPFTLAARGVVTLRYWAVSAAGRKGEVSTALVKVDTTAPVGFSLEDEGALTPSRSALNVSLRGVIDAESGYDAIEYKVGDSAGDDRYRYARTVPAFGPWLAADGLFLPFGSPVVVTLRVRNRAGLWSAWTATNGIAVDETAWDHAVWNAVLGAAGGYSATADGLGLHQGTLGESVLGMSTADDGLLDSGFWSLFRVPKMTLDLTLGDYRANASAAEVVVELRLPGTTTVVEKHTVMATATGSLTLALGRTGTFDVAIKGSHWLRRVVRNVTVTAAGASLGAVSLTNGDVDGNNQITAVDYAKVKLAYGARPGQPAWNPAADLNGDNVVNLLDYTVLQRNYGKRGD